MLQETTSTPNLILTKLLLRLTTGGLLVPLFCTCIFIATMVGPAAFDTMRGQIEITRILYPKAVRYRDWQRAGSLPTATQFHSYWTPDSIETVQDYFESKGVQFLADEGYGIVHAYRFGVLSIEIGNTVSSSLQFLREHFSELSAEVLMDGTTIIFGYDVYLGP